MSKIFGHGFHGQGGFFLYFTDFSVASMLSVS